MSDIFAPSLYTVDGLIDYLEQLRHDGLGSAFVVPHGEDIDNMPTWTPEMAATLHDLEAAFEEAGGRGVELAEEIDLLRLIRDADGEVVVIGYLED